MPVVRVEVLTPPGALDRDGQRQLVAEATRIVADAAGDPALTARAWVLPTEAAEGGWGMAGTALGREERRARRRRGSRIDLTAATGQFAQYRRLLLQARPVRTALL